MSVLAACVIGFVFGVVIATLFYRHMLWEISAGAFQ
jgi:uncharacterized membrane protein YgaE (UPF0421/DUF939 family)